MLRKILFGFAILVFLLCAAGLFLYLRIRPRLRAIAEQEAKERDFLQPRLVSGAGIFERRSFYVGQGLGNISQILVGWPADREVADIAVVASQGADFIDSTGRAKKQVRFSIQQWGPVTVARMNSTGEYGYLTRNESWAVPATFFDKEGRVSWHSGGRWPGIDDSVPGDVFGDGRLCVVMGLNGGGGLVLLDGQGQQLWQKAETNVWHVETLDTNGDGREEILHSNARGQLFVRNATGDVISQYLPGFYVSGFALTRWGDEARATHIIVPTTEGREGCCKPIFVVLDATGKTVAKLESPPLGSSLNQIAAIPVQFGKGRRYFAVLQNSFAKERSALLLYDNDGQIAYQEILAETCLGMATLPGIDANQFLVGCASKIWQYSPVPQVSGAKKASTPQAH
jgi:hypothetical protein